MTAGRSRASGWTAKRDEIVALTQELVRIPTVNPPGDAYAPCAELIGERLRRRGFEVAYLRAEGTPGDSDALSAHQRDGPPRERPAGPVRPLQRPYRRGAGRAGLDRRPLGAARSATAGSTGRGTCDMKGGLAAAIVAVETLIESGIRLPGALEISGTVDEESGGYGGVAWLAGKGFFSRPRVDHVIIPEPLNVDRVCIGHRGVWWAEIETMGRIAHGSMPFLGDCAVRHMAAVIDAFERELWPALAARRTAMPVVPDGARASTMNLNSIHGGQSRGPCRPAQPLRARQLPAGDRPPVPDRGGAGRGEGRGARHCSSGWPPSGPGSATACATSWRCTRC